MTGTQHRSGLSAKDTISRGVIALMRKDIALTSVLMRHRLIAEPTIPTFVINGRSLKYNPDFAQALSEEQVQFVLAHEALHIALGHHLREDGLASLEDVNPDTDRLDKQEVHALWNKACDYAINDLLRGAHIMPDGLPMMDAAEDGLVDNEAAEWYYSELRKRRRQGESGGGGCPPQPVPATGEVCQQDAGAVDPLQAEKEWREMVTEATIAAAACGSSPGFLKELAQAASPKAKLNWKSRLRQFATKTVRGGINWSRPRRSAAWRTDIMLPANRRKTVRNIMLAVDTSLSMSAAECNMALCELQGIIKVYRKATIRFVQCDTAIAYDETFGPLDAAKVDQLVRSPEWSGRGGTDMGPVMRLAEKDKPQAVVLLTDGYMLWPTPPHGIPVLWLMTTFIVPPWGEHVEMKQQ